jgi:hypothetical protein
MQRRRKGKYQGPKNIFGTNPPSKRPLRPSVPGRAGRKPPPKLPNPRRFSYDSNSLCVKYIPNCQEIKIDGETFWCLDRVYFDSGTESNPLLGREEKKMWIERKGGGSTPTEMEKIFPIAARKPDVGKEHIFLLNPGSARLSEFRIWVTGISKMPREVTILENVGEMKEIAEFPLDKEKFVKQEMSVSSRVQGL